VHDLDLPVFHLAALRALDPTSLVLPGAVSGSHGRSNLVVANVPDPRGLVSGTLTVTIEALSEDGATLGESRVTMAAGETLFLQDIVAVLGGPDVATTGSCA
jgi:hypothetical protein